MIHLRLIAGESSSVDRGLPKALGRDTIVVKALAIDAENCSNDS